MTVLIDNRQDLISYDEELEGFVKDVIKAALEYEKSDVNYEISISLVNNEEIRRLNKEYRNIDKATDVLSFPLIDFKKDKICMTSDRELLLGDIVISTDKTKEQAIEYGHSFKKELAFLLVHGTLHLLGYDHEIKSDEDKMLARQRKIIKLLAIGQ